MKYLKSILIFASIIALLLVARQEIGEKTKQLNDRYLVGTVIDKRISNTRHGDEFHILIQYPTHSTSAEVSYANYYYYKVGMSYKFGLDVGCDGLVGDFYNTNLMSTSKEWLNVAILAVYFGIICTIVFTCVTLLAMSMSDDECY